MRYFFFFLSIINISLLSCAQSGKVQYTKIERMIAMRDGVKLFTAIYIPKNSSVKIPILLERTPYSCNPYGEDKQRAQLGPSRLFAGEEYIHVYQDVRGRYMSEGKFEETTPHIANKRSNKDVDESSDTYDTIEWLLRNIENNNGKVGMYGISYPGFYATAALPNAHPALKAVSPQAPVTDEFEGDDAYHRGAFFLMDNYSFMNGFDYPRDTPWTSYPPFCSQEIPDAYTYYLKMGPIKNANELCFDNKSKIWNEYLLHDTKDEYWQTRDIRQHLQNIKPAVLVVGGWYDAEDLFGALKTYGAIEKRNSKNNNRLIMGPWTHGGWARGNWSGYSTIDFQTNTAAYFQKAEFDFFTNYLKGAGDLTAAEATVFETGSNKWKEYPVWPPANAKPVNWFLGNTKTLSFTATNTASGFDEYVSDPANPVPYMNTNRGGRNNEYMVADQRFASARKDVLSYESKVLENDVTLSGPITAHLFVSTTGTDADFVVKVIDVLPDTAGRENQKDVAGMQRLVRAEVLRGKFRNSYSNPEPFVPGKITEVKYELNDVAHCFKKGHKIMVQVQSSWFPLVDRNPQKFMSIPKADEKDFQAATMRIYHDAAHPSSIEVLQLTR
ncbi:MAG: CocE/NonD family hydrolase [Segetibacter sp.]|nr:CocE/NonD family hydrolase [Segetibacter sp.]